MHLDPEVLGRERTDLRAVERCSLVRVDDASPPV